MNTTEVQTPWGTKQIVDFNIHGLKVGAKDGQCPKCSDQRSTNQKRKANCASYDWNTGVITCHHCGEKTQMHNLEWKHESDKVYVRPENKSGTLPDKAIEWFSSRGISSGTLSALRVGYGREWMPQTGQNENAIHFNYFIGDELINTKYRDGRKNFKLVKGAERVFYNLNSIFNTDSVVIVEGEMDVLALHEAGVYNAVSVPNGATIGSNNLDYLDNCIDYFADKEKIILALDEDEAGQALRYEFIRRLGAELCYIARFDEVKDANECLTRFGADKLRSVIDSATPVPLS